MVVPQVELETFLGLAKQAVGYDTARPADASTQKLTDHTKFLSALSCFHNIDETQRPVKEILRDSASLCAHLSFTFAFGGSREVIFKSMERSGLKHTVADGLTGMQLAIVSGNLQEWKTSTLECCTQDGDFELRLLYDKVLLIFEKLGFKELWHDVRKQAHKDKTFYLERKS